MKGATRATPATRKLVPVLRSSASSSKLNQVSIAQFNILAGKLASPDHFPYVEPAFLEWERRRETLLAEIQQLTVPGTSDSTSPIDTMPDFLCMEELSNYWDFFSHKLRELGYESVYLKRPSIHASTWSGVDKEDGCGIFYKRSRYRLILDHSVNFKDIHDRCGLLVLLQLVQPHETETASATSPSSSSTSSSLGKYILVANTHLYWNPKKLSEQMAELKEMETAIMEIQALVRDKYGQAQLPTLFCGDFNNGPSSPIYSYLLESFLVSSDTKNDETNNETASSSSSTEKTTIIPPMRSAYGVYKLAIEKGEVDEQCRGGPEFEPDHTTVTYKRSWTIDYIWYSHSTLRLTHLLEIPPKEALQMEDGSAGWIDRFNEKLEPQEQLDKQKNYNGIPNSVFGSDHLPIMAVFELI
jgi:CCR4-NOT transcription complex subunit 6